MKQLTFAVAFTTLMSAVCAVGQEAPFERVEPATLSAQQPASHLFAADVGSEPQLPGVAWQPRALKPLPLYRSNDISLEGHLSTQITGGVLNIHADKLANNRTGGTSGTLRISVWATTSPTSFGAAINGYRVGYYQLSSTLPGGYYFSPVDHNVPYATAPNGVYYVTMTADEYSSSNNPSVNDGYGYHDLVLLDGFWTFGPPPPPQTPPCSFSLSSFGASAGPSGGTGSVSVTGSPNPCNGSWTAFSNASWITILSGSSGSGAGTTALSFSVAPASASRTGTMTIAGQTFTVTQTVVTGPPPPPGCPTTDTTLCLNSRFSVSATWRTSDGNSGQGHGVALTTDTGYFWFFGSNNIELVIKVLNGCAISQRYWVFAGGLTNVNVTITVRDIVTGSVKTYTNPGNIAFQPIQDTGAFATCQ